MIFILDAPYDYHQQGQILVRARSKAEAVRKLQDKYPKPTGDNYSYGVGTYVNRDDLLNRLTPLEGDIYENEGCDC